MTLKVTLVQGGGMGLDQVPAVKRVLSAAGVRIEWDEHLAGWASMERGGAPLPEELLQSVRATGLALKTKLLPPPGPPPGSAPAPPHPNPPPPRGEGRVGESAVAWPATPAAPITTTCCASG
jgi:isocitrate dehydrogenase